jgi:hypothetical protein
MRIKESADQVLMEPLLALLRELPLPLPTPQDASIDTMLDFIFSIIRNIGFTGTSQALLTTCGVFYPQEVLHQEHSLKLQICTSLFWTFGHPALCVDEAADSLSYTSGVFIGKVDASTATDCCLRSGVQLG